MEIVITSRETIHILPEKEKKHAYLQVLCDIRRESHSKNKKL